MDKYPPFNHNLEKFKWTEVNEVNFLFEMADRKMILDSFWPFTLEIVMELKILDPYKYESSHLKM